MHMCVNNLPKVGCYVKARDRESYSLLVLEISDQSILYSTEPETDNKNRN